MLDIEVQVGAAGGLVDGQQYRIRINGPVGQPGLLYDFAFRGARQSRITVLAVASRLHPKTQLAVQDQQGC